MTSPRPGMLRRWYPVLLALLGALLSLAVYSRLPDPMAVHWNVQGRADGWMPRRVAAFFGPVFLLVIWQVLRLARRIDPRQANYSRFDDAYETIVAAVLGLLLATHVITIAVALGYQVPVGRLVPALVGMLFVVTGNVMPRLRANWWFGVRTPWTLSDDRVWARTHRLAGYCMTGAGLVTILAALVVPPAMGIPVMLGATVAAVFAPAIYSYLAWRRDGKG